MELPPAFFSDGSIRANTPCRIYIAPDVYWESNLNYCSARRIVLQRNWRKVVERAELKQGDVVKFTYCLVTPVAIKVERATPEEAANASPGKVTVRTVTKPGHIGATEHTSAKTPVNGVGLPFHPAAPCDRDLAASSGP